MHRISVLAAALVATTATTFAMAQASAPKTREEVKAETRAAQEAGQMTPAGGGEAPKAKSTSLTVLVKSRHYAHFFKQEVSLDEGSAGV